MTLSMVFLLIFIIYQPLILGRNKIQLFVNKIGMCPGFESSPIQLKNVKISYNEEKNFMVSYTVDISRYVSKDANLKVNIRRCASKEAPDSCTKFANLNMKNACKLCSANTFHSAFTDCLKPPMRCPISKKTLRGENCTFNMDAFRMFPLTGYYWKAKIQLFHPVTNECIFCGYGEAGVRQIQNE